MFLHEELAVLYMPEEQDEKFVRFAVPNLYDVTEENRQYLIDQEDRISEAMNGKIRDSRHRLSVYAERFAGLSPLHRLQSGYSYVSLPGGPAVTSIEQITPGDTIDVYVTDGSYRAAVLSKAKKGDIGNG